MELLPMKTYDYLFTELSDNRVIKWPLMAGPWAFLAIVIAYVYLVFYLLPKFMENRKPFKLKFVIMLYNVFQIISCTFLIYGVLTSGWTTYYSLACQPVDYSNSQIATRMATYMWWHMVLKMTELIETVFFVLRKKQNQVSILHVYHHVSTFYFAWFTAKYAPGGMLTFTVLINSLVHIIMYGYYFLSACGPNMQKKLSKMKPWVTTIQVVQLVIILIHSLQALNSSCNIPRIVPYTYLPNIVINILLFLNFYRKSYNKTKAKSI